LESTSKRQRWNHGGFTLIELLVVIAVIDTVVRCIADVESGPKAASKTAVCVIESLASGTVIQTLIIYAVGIYRGLFRRPHR